jgi:hypothetical protein
MRHDALRCGGPALARIPSPPSLARSLACASGALPGIVIVAIADSVITGDAMRRRTVGGHRVAVPHRVHGGAIEHEGKLLRIDRSAFSGNEVEGTGGGSALHPIGSAPPQRDLRHRRVRAPAGLTNRESTTRGVST